MVTNPTFNEAASGSYTLIFTVTDNNGCIGSDNVLITVNELPTTTLIASINPICTGTNVTFTAGAGGGPPITNYNFLIGG